MYGNGRQRPVRLKTPFIAAPFSCSEILSVAIFGEGPLVCA